jgi:hypothetical protein
LTREFCSGFRHAIKKAAQGIPERLFCSDAQALTVARLGFLRAFFALNPLVDFFPMHGDFFRGINTDANLVPLYSKDGYGNVITDHQSFANAASQYQHVLYSLIQSYLFRKLR